MIQNEIKNQFKTNIVIYFKKYWWVVLITVILFSFIILLITSQERDSKDKKDYIDNENKLNQKQEETPYMDDRFEKCPSDLSNLFTNEVIENSKVDYIVPLGMLNASSHTIPTDHIYMMSTTKNEHLPVYAPSDAIIMGGENKMTYDSQTDQIKRNDFSLDLVLCRGLVLNFTHFQELSPRLTEEYNNQKINCPQGKYHFGDDMSTYYKPCGYSFEINVKAGELLGYTIDSGYDSGIDIGLYNFNTPALGYISPQRYSIYNLHATCPLDLFIPEIKNEYYKKLGQYNYADKSGKANPTLVFRTVEPRCGENMFDVPKAAKGNWYSGEKGVGSESTEYMMALVPDYIDPNSYQLSLKGPESLGTFVNLLFIPTYEGNINRAYEQVTNDGIIYCYQDPMNTQVHIDKSGKVIPTDNRKFIIQLIDDVHLKIERQDGVCTGQEIFVSPTIFER